MSLTKGQWVLVIFSSFLILSILFFSASNNNTDKTIEKQEGLRISKFVPAFLVDNDFNYYIVDNNNFSSPIIWFYVYVEDLTIEYDPIVEQWYEHYALNMTIADDNGNIMPSHSNVNIDDIESYYIDNITYESVRFDYDINDLENGKYNVRLELYDYLAQKSVFKDTYIVVDR